jgi:hypothetical protein
MRHRYQQFRHDPFHLFRKSRGSVDAVSSLGVPESLRAFQQWKYSIRSEGIRRIWKEQYINDYSDGGPELAALHRLVRGVRAAGVPFLVVLMPTSDEWAGLHPGGANDVERFKRLLASFVKDWEVPFVDPTPEFSSHDFFVDPLHLNAAGMKRFAEVLASPIAELLRSTGHPIASTPPPGRGPGSFSAGG